MVKSQVKLLVFEKMLSAQYPLSPCWKVTKLGTMGAPRKWMTPIDFEEKRSKVKVKLLIFVQMLTAQYLLTPLLENP